MARFTRTPLEGGFSSLRENARGPSVVLLSLREQGLGLLALSFESSVECIWSLQAEIRGTVGAHFESRIPPFLSKGDHFGQGMTPPAQRNISKADSKFGITPLNLTQFSEERSSTTTVWKRVLVGLAACLGPSKQLLNYDIVTCSEVRSSNKHYFSALF